jgi:hypothetical protein
MLRSWNEIEGLGFEKVEEQSYFKLDHTWPDPICSKKMTESVYFSNINDKYISISTGSENKNCRNTNVENIYKAEDRLFELDMQIDNIAKSLAILKREIATFELLPPEQQAHFKLPHSKFQPLNYLWDKKARGRMLEDFLSDDRVLTHKDLM